MSLDIWGSINTGGDATVEVWSFNITHNLSKMWDWAGCGDALYDSYDKRASDILPALEKALAKLKAEPNVGRKYDAPNGWGTYEQAVPWLEGVIEACRKHPATVIGISK